VGILTEAAVAGACAPDPIAELAAPAATAINATIITTRVRRLLMVRPPSI
jgi:hypothetical protein